MLNMRARAVSTARRFLFVGRTVGPAIVAARTRRSPFHLLVTGVGTPIVPPTSRRPMMYPPSLRNGLPVSRKTSRSPDDG